MALDIDISELDIAALEELRDLVNRRLLTLRRSPATRLEHLLELFEHTKSALQDQGKEWFSLERWQWMEGSLRFWLNPRDQASYRAGWFTIDELIAWVHDAGPIVKTGEEEEQEEDDDRFYLAPVNFAA